jgi:predicted nucleic acid-binding protein
VSHFYLDASAVVKRYSLESGSAWVEALTASTSGHTTVLSEITLVEVAAALAAKHRAPGGLTQKERDEAVALFLSHCHTEYELIAVNRSIIDRAVTLTQNHKLRGYDAMQLATALAANEALTTASLSPLTLIAADDDLVAAPRTEGLAAENPLSLASIH